MRRLQCLLNEQREAQEGIFQVPPRCGGGGIGEGGRGTLLRVEESLDADADAD